MNIIGTTLRASLHDAFGRDVEVVLNPDGDSTVDAVLALALGGPPLRLNVEVRSTATSSVIAELSRRADGHPVILFVPRLTPAVTAACRRLGVNGADADGNVFIRSGSSVIDIAGRPTGASRELLEARRGSTRLAGRSGLQILFLLLVDPEFCNQPYRAIADAAGVSLGTVAAVFTELEQDGYLATDAGERRLRRTPHLLDLWTEGYRTRLFDRLRLGTFTTERAEWWRTAGSVVKQAGGQWSGETAVWASGYDLRPARGIAYVADVPPTLVAELRLRRDAHGPNSPAELRRRFWTVPAWDSNTIVPAVLVYADLLADGDPRLVEAAAALRRDDDTLRRLDAS